MSAIRFGLEQTFNLALAMFLFLPTISFSATFIVTSTSDGVDRIPGDGICSTIGGQCTLRAAVMEANARPGADTVSMGPGVYRLTIPGQNENASATGDLDILDDLTIVGVRPEDTIIDGGRIDRVIQINLVEGSNILENGQFETIQCANTESINVSLSNLTVRNGEITHRWGGGIENYGDLTLDNVYILNNTAFARGGGISTSTSSNEGCGNLINATNILVQGNTVLDNPARATGISNREHGSGIYFQGQRRPGLTLSRSRILGNTGSYGVSIHLEAVSRISDTTIDGNTAGLYTLSCLVMNNTTISNNGPGRAMEIQQECTEPALVRNSTISGNFSFQDDWYGRNSIFVSSYSGLDLEFTTITNNQVGSGAAIIAAPDFCDTLTRCGVFLKSSIISNANGSASGIQECQGDLVVSNGGNIDSDNSCNLIRSDDRPTTDPLLDVLGFNGGLTQTHALSVGSPAIDLADSLRTCVMTDQRGQVRPIDGDGDGFAYCDSGAYEYFRPDTSAVSLPPWAEQLVDITDLICTINAPFPVFTRGCLEIGPAEVYLPPAQQPPINCIADGPGCFELLRIDLMPEGQLLPVYFISPHKLNLMLFSKNEGVISPMQNIPQVYEYWLGDSYFYYMDTWGLKPVDYYLGLKIEQLQQ